MLADVVAVLVDAVPRGRAELVYVARKLGVPTRTLQRRLRAAGTSWTRLLAETRRRTAEELLRDPGLTVEEVAVLLGYADASVFHRAFRRWTGSTPGAWRAPP